MSLVGLRDGLIRDAIAASPDWLDRKIWPRLVGYPDPESCWQWMGALRAGYGTVGLPGASAPTVVVHRVVWLALRGAIPEGQVLDHDEPGIGCHNRACSNPAHLLPTTVRRNTVVNSTRSVSAIALRATHCPRGHQLGAGNLRPCLAAIGQRGCITCHREKAKEQFAAVRTAARALGLTQAQYARQFGCSARIALQIVTTLGRN